MPLSPPVRRAVAALTLGATLHAALASYAAPAYADGAPSLVERGRTLFEDQQYEESVQALSGALVRPATSRADKIETYRLLAYNFVVLGRKDEAEAAVRGLFVLDPEFTLPRKESPRFRDFFAEVRRRWEEEGRPGAAIDAEAKPAKAVTMAHASPAEGKRGEEIVLRARIDDPDRRVDSVHLFYRKGTQGKFVDATAQRSGADVRVALPPTAVEPPLVEYYLQAFDKAKLPLASRGDAGAPLRVVVQGAEETSFFASPWLWGGVGAVAAGAIVGVLVLGKKSDSGGGAGGAGGGGGGSPSAHVVITVKE